MNLLSEGFAGCIFIEKNDQVGIDISSSRHYIGRIRNKTNVFYTF